MMMQDELETGYDFSGVRALVVGLAREGTSLARFLAEHHAQVVATDVKPVEALTDSLAALDGLPITFALGGHPLGLLDKIDIVFVSPGVPLEIPLVEEAHRRHIPLSSETRLFARLCPALVVGITGSSGKTTTTTLVGRMLQEAGRPTWVGGNIGQPLIGSLEEIKPAEVVVLELSSFQLDLFGPQPEVESRVAGHPVETVFDPSGWSPEISAILNITPNHLDRHVTMEAYAAAKANVLAYGQPGDIAVLNRDDPLTRELGQHVRQELLWFSLEGEVDRGAYLRGDQLVLRLSDREKVVCRTGELKLLGKHNVANMLAACAISAAAGATVEVLRDVATSFSAVKHRLEHVREWHGVQWYNDSIATAPERTTAALNAFRAPIVLLAGGRDKKLPWDEMAALTWRRAKHAILFGEAAGHIKEALERTAPAAGEGGAKTTIHDAGTLEQAVDLAAKVAQRGDVVLLSPGGTSFDAYQDYEERGEHFRQLVEALE
ncbi:MAG: UDP-N-acetylmuramoyl-L-alanine--D-glutamate ligase [Anaerolineae bacterium]|nr:UDP-N-acetylmuramoyl-L-alanine--D-glutamate ligase [Anaerolineae bacterium]